MLILTELHDVYLFIRNGFHSVFSDLDDIAFINTIGFIEIIIMPQPLLFIIYTNVINVFPEEYITIKCTAIVFDDSK